MLVKNKTAFFAKHTNIPVWNDITYIFYTKRPGIQGGFFPNNSNVMFVCVWLHIITMRYFQIRLWHSIKWGGGNKVEQIRISRPFNAAMVTKFLFQKKLICNYWYTNIGQLLLEFFFIFMLNLRLRLKMKRIHPILTFSWFLVIFCNVSCKRNKLIGKNCCK